MTPAGPAGIATATQIAELMRQAGELDARMQALEATHEVDGAALASIYKISNAGDVTENVFIQELVEAAEAEEPGSAGELLIVEGGKVKRAKTALRVHSGAVLVSWEVEGFEGIGQIKAGKIPFTPRLLSFPSGTGSSGGQLRVMEYTILETGAVNVAMQSSGAHPKGFSKEVNYIAIG